MPGISSEIASVLATGFGRGLLAIAATAILGAAILFMAWRGARIRLQRLEDMLERRDRHERRLEYWTTKPVTHPITRVKGRP